MFGCRYESGRPALGPPGPTRSTPCAVTPARRRTARSLFLGTGTTVGIALLVALFVCLCLTLLVLCALLGVRALTEGGITNALLEAGGDVRHGIGVSNHVSKDTGDAASRQLQLPALVFYGRAAEPGHGLVGGRFADGKSTGRGDGIIGGECGVVTMDDDLSQAEALA